jgi:hypothetical protein
VITIIDLPIHRENSGKENEDDILAGLRPASVSTPPRRECRCPIFYLLADIRHSRDQEFFICPTEHPGNDRKLQHRGNNKTKKLSKT